jgi:hypothetical protein
MLNAPMAKRFPRRYGEQTSPPVRCRSGLVGHLSPFEAGAAVLSMTAPIDAIADQ